jgi:hypothetical protein
MFFFFFFSNMVVFFILNKVVKDFSKSLHEHFFIKCLAHMFFTIYTTNIFSPTYLDQTTKEKINKETTLYASIHKSKLQKEKKKVFIHP